MSGNRRTGNFKSTQAWEVGTLGLALPLVSSRDDLGQRSFSLQASVICIWDECCARSFRFPFSFFHS